jgi:hypothetical protein
MLVGVPEWDRMADVVVVGSSEGAPIATAATFGYRAGRHLAASRRREIAG